MRRALSLSLLVTVALCTASAAEPVASVRSAAAFKVQGVSVPSTVTTAWPLISGDEITTGASPASILLLDGTRVNLGSDSRLKIDTSSAETTLHILSGSLSYKKSGSSQLSIVSLDGRIKAGQEGTVAAKQNGSLAGPSRPGTFRADLFGPPPTSNFR
jgi:hypothetical protein